MNKTLLFLILFMLIFISNNKINCVRLQRSYDNQNEHIYQMGGQNKTLDTKYIIIIVVIVVVFLMIMIGVGIYVTNKNDIISSPIRTAGNPTIEIDRAMGYEKSLCAQSFRPYDRNPSLRNPVGYQECVNARRDMLTRQYLMTGNAGRQFQGYDM